MANIIMLLGKSGTGKSTSIKGLDSKETVERAFGYPIIDVLQKPFNERDVKRVIEKMVSIDRNI